MINRVAIATGFSNTVTKQRSWILADDHLSHASKDRNWDNNSRSEWVACEDMLFWPLMLKQQVKHNVNIYVEIVNKKCRNTISHEEMLMIFFYYYLLLLYSCCMCPKSSSHLFRHLHSEPAFQPTSAAAAAAAQWSCSWTASPHSLITAVYMNSLHPLWPAHQLRVLFNSQPTERKKERTEEKEEVLLTGSSVNQKPDRENTASTLEPVWDCREGKQKPRMRARLSRERVYVSKSLQSS